MLSYHIGRSLTALSTRTVWLRSGIFVWDHSPRIVHYIHASGQKHKHVLMWLHLQPKVQQLAVIYWVIVRNDYSLTAAMALKWCESCTWRRRCRTVGLGSHLFHPKVWKYKDDICERKGIGPIRFPDKANSILPLNPTSLKWINKVLSPDI